MPAIRVNRDNVVITIEIEPCDDPPEASFYDAETNSWQDRIPTSQSRFVNSSKSQTATGPGVTSLSPLGSPIDGHGLPCPVLVPRRGRFQIRRLLQPDARRSHRRTPATHRHCVRGYPPTLNPNGASACLPR